MMDQRGRVYFGKGFAHSDAGRLCGFVGRDRGGVEDGRKFEVYPAASDAFDVFARWDFQK